MDLGRDWARMEGMMTTDELKELLAMGDAGYTSAFDELERLAPQLARRVIAADKLVEALRGASEDLDDYSPLTGNAIETNAAKRCRDALSEYESTK